MLAAKRIAINGYGRIGRAILRAIVERGLENQLQIVAINDLGIAESVVYETRYDSVHGIFPATVEATDQGMQVVTDQGMTNINLLQVADADTLPWADLGIDLVLECSGNMSDRKRAQQHLNAGASKVLIGDDSMPRFKLIMIDTINHRNIHLRARSSSNQNLARTCV